MAGGAAEREGADAWPPVPDKLALGTDDVHVWVACLDLDASRLKILAEVLSEEENGRARRLVFQQHRERFTAAHGILRHVLAHYVGTAPGQLQFAKSAHGKPSLAGEGADAELRFNMSHSAARALYAVTRGREVGIDIERVSPDRDHNGIAERFFSGRETAALRALPKDQQCEGFFNCWTRKEAYLKATGKGLAIPLNRLAVSLAPGEPAAFLPTDGGADLASEWSLHDLSVGPGYAAALCVQGGGCTITCREWPS